MTSHFHLQQGSKKAQLPKADASEAANYAAARGANAETVGRLKEQGARVDAEDLQNAAIASEFVVRSVVQQKRKRK